MINTKLTSLWLSLIEFIKHEAAEYRKADIFRVALPVGSLQCKYTSTSVAARVTGPTRRARADHTLLR